MYNHEQYVSFSTAKLLKDAGFDWDCCKGYNQNGNFNEKCRTELDWNSFGDFYAAPTPDMARQWLREVLNYEIVIDFICIDGFEGGTIYYVRTILDKDNMDERYESPYVIGQAPNRHVSVEKDASDHYHSSYYDALDEAIVMCCKHNLREIEFSNNGNKG